MLTKRKPPRDPAGFVVDERPSPFVRKVREREARNAAARAELDARAVERDMQAARIAPALRAQRARAAQRELDEHLAELDAELAWQRSRSRPNPWLKPWDPEYSSPEEKRLRRETAERRAGGLRSTPAQTGDPFVDSANDMEATMNRLRARRSSPGLKTSSELDRQREASAAEPATIAAALRAMTPEEIASRGPNFAARRRQYLLHARSEERSVPFERT